MPLYDLNEFLRLSDILNLQWAIKTTGGANVASIIVDNKQISGKKMKALKQVLAYLGEAYGDRRRRLGPLSVLHPLRATALLAQVQKKPSLLDLLACLLHDKLEDLTPESLGRDQWDRLEGNFQALLKSIDPEDEWFLMERLDRLTRRPGETYFGYIGRLLDQASRTAELVRIKLADRLDNTLDLHIGMDDPIEGVDFFGILFQVLCVNSFSGTKPVKAHPAPSPINGAERLYQLFKNAVLMSMIRSRQLAKDDPIARSLFDAMAMASAKEAQRITLHIFTYHLTDVVVQRELVREAMDYARQGFLGRVTLPHSERRLDGLFLSRFKDSDSAIRKKSLADLYENKELMVEAAVAFLIIFLNFLNDPDYFVEGISEQGIQPAP